MAYLFFFFKQKTAYEIASCLVGSIDHPRDSFAAMNAAIQTNDIRPVVDRTFPMEEAQEAYQYQADQAHFGKVVISI